MERLKYRARNVEVRLEDIRQALDLIEKGDIPPDAEIFYPMCNMWMTVEDFKNEIFPFQSRTTKVSGCGWTMIAIAGVVCLSSIYFIAAGGLAFFTFLVTLPGPVLIVVILVVFGALGVLFYGFMSATDR